MRRIQNLLVYDILFLENTCDRISTRSVSLVGLGEALLVGKWCRRSGRRIA